MIDEIMTMPSRGFIMPWFAVCLVFCSCRHETRRTVGRNVPAAAVAEASGQAPRAAGKEWLQAKHSDRDGDYRPHQYYDRDDREILRGRLAGRQELDRVAGVIAKYYRAAVATDGDGACLLLYGLFAEAIAESQETTGTIRDACARALSRLFERRHRQIAMEQARLRAINLHVEGPRAEVLLDTGVGRPLYMNLRKEGSVWRLTSALASELG